MKIAAALTFLPLAFLFSPPSHAEVSTSKDGSVVTYHAPAAIAGLTIDYRNAKPLPQPKASGAVQASAPGQATPRVFPGLPQAVSGAAGNGTRSPVPLAEAQGPSRNGDGPTTYAYGTSNQPYTTARVDAYGDQTSGYYPYRAAGKLFFVVGGTSYYCSASLIKLGVVVTAAHCLANFGHQQFYSGFSYVPAYESGHAPYGVWGVQYVTVPNAWYKGTDSCTVKGLICQNDVGVLVLKPQNGAYAGAQTGYFGYGYNGYGFTSANTALIDELGYSDALDSAKTMERSSSQGFVAANRSNNTIIGSLQSGGSDGAPWLVNLGIPPQLASGTTNGSDAEPSVVVGVTSWTAAAALKQQGASSFTTTNIVALLNNACGMVPSACQ